MKTNSKILLAAGAIAAWALLRKATGAAGIGATKRRIYKEISLAQKAGVDFSKKYEDLTEDEIVALERVSSNTGFTETYYKGLKKAYDAISGIGAAYDVTDEDGNTVLTWIEDPEAQAPSFSAVDEAERYAALREARAIDEDRQYASERTEQERKDREARLAERRKRLRKGGRSSQMQLFGTGYIRIQDVLEPELLDYLRASIDKDRIDYAIDTMTKRREPLHRVDISVYDDIIELTEDWCVFHAVDPDSIWEVAEPDDILFIL